MSSSNFGKYGKLPTGEYDDDDIGHYSLQQKVRNQNKNLDILSDSVKRLGDLSLNISKEIESQNVILDSLEDEVDKVQTASDILITKTNDLIKKTG